MRNPSIVPLAVLAMLGSIVLLAACNGSARKSPEATRNSAGFAPRITVFDASLDAIVATDAVVEQLASGYRWSEGPMWWPAENALLFNDVPENTMYRWHPATGVEVFMRPSGLSEPDPDRVFREPGANGMVLADAGHAIVADHGTRAVVRLDLRTRQKTVLADRFEGRRFSSPNDVALRHDGRIYFSDPPYGLRDIDDSPAKEQPHNGVYRLDPDGRVVLIDAGLSFPNGVALSPGGKLLYVANSDAKSPILMRYTLDDAGDVVERSQFFDASSLLSADAPGLPDGMAIATSGEVFATGPGGVLVLSPQGKLLGRIETGTAIANCAFGDDGSTLYLTSHHLLARVATRVRGTGF